MAHRNPVAQLAVPALAFVVFALTGCFVDNSGGPPPAGDAVVFEVAIDGPNYFCGDTSDNAHLIVDASDVDAFLEACGMDIIGDDTTVAEDLNAEVDALEEGQALVVVNAVLGGCLGDWRIQAVHRDGDTLRPWMLKADSAYGRANTACTADIGQGNQVLVVEGAADAIGVALTVGIYNPDLPGSPDEPVEALAAD